VASGEQVDGSALVIRYETTAGAKTVRLTPGPMRVAGRGAYVDLGDEPTMHRSVAAFECIEGRWFVLNLLAPPKRLTIAGRHQGGLAPRLVAPREDAELPPGRLRLSFRIGADLRSLDVDVPPRPAVADTIPLDELAPRTRDSRLRIELKPARRLLAVALAELRLMDPTSSTPLPSKAEVRERLGWSDKSYDNHLDQLCAQLEAAGVQGVVGERGAEAARRREIAVEVLIENELIGVHDLDLLPPP